MIKASKAYKNMMNSPLRNRCYISVSLGIINQSAQADAKVISNRAYWSVGDVFVDEPIEPIDYGTLEQKGVVSDGSFMFMPENDQYLNNGVVTPNFLGTIKIKLGKKYDIKGLTLNFGAIHPSKFKVITETKELEYTNEEDIFVTEDVLGTTDFINIIPITMVGGQQRLRIKHILLGVGLSFTNATIQNVTLEDYVSSVSKEVSYSNYSIQIFDTKGRFDVDNDESFMGYLEPLQDVGISIGVDLPDGTQEWLKVATAYMKEWTSTKGKLSISATDMLTQLDGMYEHLVLQERTAYSEFVNILEAAGFDDDQYVIDDFLKNVIIKNPITLATYRECLQILANFCRCIVYEDENGIFQVKANFETVLDPDDLIYYTNDEASWSNVENVVKGKTYEYSDLTGKRNLSDGSNNFLPDVSTQYSVETAYTSNSIANNNGLFTENPYILLTLPAKYSYYGLSIDFGTGVVPHKVKITTYDYDTQLQSIEYDELYSVSYLLDNFYMFNKIKIEVTKTEPNARVVINKITLGDATDYALTKTLMLDNPYGTREPRVKDVRIKINTYEYNDKNELKLIDDENYYTYNINETGTVKNCNNPLVHNEASAEVLGEWLANYYDNNVSYTNSFRGEPRLQAGDIIRMDSDFNNNLQVAVEKTKLTFNGAFSGELQLRKALSKGGN